MSLPDPIKPLQYRSVDNGTGSLATLNLLNNCTLDIRESSAPGTSTRCRRGNLSLNKLSRLDHGGPMGVARQTEKGVRTQ